MDKITLSYELSSDKRLATINIRVKDDQPTIDPETYAAKMGFEGIDSKVEVVITCWDRKPLIPGDTRRFIRHITIVARDTKYVDMTGVMHELNKLDRMPWDGNSRKLASSEFSGTLIQAFQVQEIVAKHITEEVK